VSFLVVWFFMAVIAYTTEVIVIERLSGKRA
jgi:hypothetical protein